MTLRAKAIWLAVLLLGAAAGFYVASGRTPDVTPPPPAAAAGPAGVGALGRVEPASRIRRLAPSSTQQGTRIARLMVEEGEQVRAGQVLAEFNDSALRDAALAEAEAQLAEARARLARTRAGGRASEVTAQRARVEALRNAEASARREAERSERLQRSGAGAEATAERNRYAANQARAERAEAEAALDTLLSPRPEDLALAEAEFAAAEAGVARARAEAALTRLRAPIDGTIMRILARTGEGVASDGVLEMADLTAMDVVAEVFETDLPRVRAGAPAEIVVPGEPRRFAATVREIGWQVRRTTQASTDPVAAVDARTVEVRLALAPDGVAALSRRSNMQVQVAIRP